jgi:LysR family transcriptional regulator, regulator for metE and metH
MNYIHGVVQPKLEVRHLRLVAEVAAHRSITRAAQRLNLTQSALSHQLRDAEEKLGTPLFRRANRKMALTAAGEKLLESARRILSDLKSTEDQIQGFQGPSGTLRLTTECYTCYHWLPPVLEAVQEKFPQVDVRIELEATSKPLAALLEGKLDVAIVSTKRNDRRIRYEPLFADELMVIMTPGHRLAKQSWIRPADLAQETLLIYPPRRESTLLKLLAGEGLDARAILEVPLTEAIIEMASAGIGIGFLARWAIAPKLLAGGLIARPLTKAGYQRHWQAATLQRQQPPEHVSQFLKLLRENLPARRKQKSS